MSNVSKQNLPIDLNYVLQEKKSSGLSTKQIAFLVISSIIIFLIMRFYSKYGAINHIKKEINNLRVGDSVIINAVSSKVSKVDHHTIYLAAVDGTGSIPIMKKDIQKIENLSKNKK